ncbi:zinc knuckle-domain-containing protein [Xylariaceae sp. FL0255]|nr:zinc knuckle-domain-containing protein [Xylariaceae sp. FL0255]
MYRRGPSKATPANVQCQKCLKRGHYSYECKASAQERPYVARPSRTQQLLNPKLKPKLASDTSNPLQKTDGLADETLAKREAERARQRELERDDDRDNDRSDPGSPKRHRSASIDSVSTISTRRSGGRDSRSPPPKVYPPPSRARSMTSQNDYERHSPRSPSEGGWSHRRSPEPLRRQRERSLSRYSSDRRSRGSSRHRSPDRRSVGRKNSRYTQSLSRSPPPDSRRRFRSRSPQEIRGRERSPVRKDERPPRRGGGRGGHQGWRAQQQQARERSLSPFSKRLALTQAMNADQR